MHWKVITAQKIMDVIIQQWYNLNGGLNEPSSKWEHVWTVISYSK